MSLEQAPAAAEPDAWRTAYPDELRMREAPMVYARRGAPVPDDPRLPPDLFGIGVSGGGIRSATFALGFFQALARYGILRKIDYLSTVSGGSYFGGFLGGLFRPR